MKFKLTIEFTYEVPDDSVEGAYGTTDPLKCARIDNMNAADDPAAFLTGSDGELTTRVEPVV